MRSYLTYFFMLVSMILYTYFFGDETSVLVIYMLILSPLLFLVVALLSWKNLEVSVDTRVDSPRIEKDDVVRVRLFLRNKSIFPIPVVFISFYIPSNMMPLSSPRIIVSLGPLKTRDVVLEYRAKYRGKARIGVYEAGIKDFLGFFRFSAIKKLDESERSRDIIVLNRIVDLQINSALLLNSVQVESSETGTTSNNLNFMNCLYGEPGHEFREYQPGDPLHKIHWKLSAKSEVLMVRKDEGGSFAKKELMLDPLISREQKPAPQNTVQREDKILEALISIINMMIKAGRDLELWLFEKGEWMKYSIKDRDEVIKMQHRLAVYRFINSVDDQVSRLPLQSITAKEIRGYKHVGGDAMVFTASPDRQVMQLVEQMQDLNMAIDLVLLKNNGFKESINSETGQPKTNTWAIGVDDDISKVFI